MSASILGGLLSVGASLFGMNKADKQAKAQAALAKQQLQLSKEEYYNRLREQQEWKEKYGGIEHNYLKYLQGLSATKIYGLQEGGLRRAYERARQNMDSHLSERGFDVSGGVHAEMFQRIADQEAMHEVELRQQSEQFVAQAQQAALTGNPQPQTPSTAGMSNALGNQMQVNAANYATQMGAYSDFAKTIGGVYQQYKKANQSPATPNNQLQVPANGVIIIKSPTAEIKKD